MELYNLRHSLSHVLAQAVQRSLDPIAQLGTWPAVDNGFYYDIKLSDWVEFGESDLKDLTKVMIGITNEWQAFGSYAAKNKDEAIQLVTMIWQSFKVELINKFYATDPSAIYTFYYNYVDAQMLPRIESTTKPEYVSAYKHITEYISGLDSSLHSEWQKFITFIDLCEWGHVDTLKDIPKWCFALNKIAGAYRQGKEWNPQMTRIYGVAFESKDELKAYETMMEEAKKRDHRVIGQKMKLFTLSEMVGSGLPLFQPNGMIIRKEIEDYLWSLHKHRWYDRVWTPHIAKEALYQCSGHAGHYLDDMFSVHGGTSKEDYFLKPMNCPHHMQIFADNQFSYRDMPVRYFEPATVYRDEKTGQLSGLTRVRAITQDDGHLFCRVGQIHQEVATIVNIIKEFYTTMGMIEGYWVSLSLRGEDKSKYLGTDEMWEQAESALREVCIAENLPYKEILGEAAFYWPKLDFMFKDAIGRERQLATAQCDFNLPSRFELSFVNETGEEERPVVIHRAISGSLERFMGVMIEHFAGNFPLWLTPEQVRIIPVIDNDMVNTHVAAVHQALQDADIRVKIDNSDDSFAKKVRNAETEKVYYALIIGEQEATDGTVSTRNVRSKEQSVVKLEDFVAQVKGEYENRKL